MTVTTSQESLDKQLFDFVYEAMVAKEDLKTAERVRDLVEQIQTSFGKTFVAFCGLFSAGKSSLLNTICGSTRLATGAVPTTALVTEILLPNSDGQIILMDTPGVDSTDDAHRQATEEALHLADVIVLVMDYQHVEAEENLSLARGFYEQGKRLVLIVNQVDKHFDFELSFSDFDMRVKNIMNDYDIHFEALFYTSSEHSPYNQVDLLMDWLAGLSDESDEHRISSYRRRLEELVEQHVHHQFEEMRELAEKSVVVAYGQVPFTRNEACAWLETARTERQQLQDELDDAVSAILNEQELYREEFVRLVELAQIAPYETTERGRLYVESLRTEFKVGWFRTKQKTAQEQLNRLKTFVDDLRTRTETYLIWPLQNRLRQFVQDTPWATRDWVDEVSLISHDVTTQEAASIVKQGALVSSQYPYQYVKDVVAAVKRSLLVQLTGKVDGWFEKALQAVQESKETELASSIKVSEAKMDAMIHWLDVHQQETDELENLLSGNGVSLSK